MMLSPHFTLTEMATTSTGLPNNPPAWAVEKLRKLCEQLLEPLRAVWNCPIRIDSGYRSEAVNAAVHGSARSQHRAGQAADIVPVGPNLVDAFSWIATLAPTLPIGQAILYVCDGFIHLSIDEGPAPRRQLLVCVDPSRKARLVPWATWREDRDHKPAPQAMTV